jgi:hypothetical protein
MDASALASAESWLSGIATAKLVAAFLVAAGVAIEFGGDWVARPYERIVSDAREAQLAALYNDTARLSAEAEVAKSKIASAIADAARANERAAEIEKVTAWRKLSADAEKKLAIAIAAIPPSVPHKIVFAYAQNDEEAQYFLFQIGRHFIANHAWDANLYAETHPGIFFWGVRITGPDNETTRAVRGALNAAGIEFSTEAVPGPFQSYGYAPKPSDTIISVGSRKPPLEP